MHNPEARFQDWGGRKEGGRKVVGGLSVEGENRAGLAEWAKLVWWWRLAVWWEVDGVDGIWMRVPSGEWSAWSGACGQAGGHCIHRP